MSHIIKSEIDLIAQSEDKNYISIKTRPELHKSNCFTPEQRKEIRYLHANGLSVMRLSKNYNCAFDAMKKYLAPTKRENPMKITVKEAHEIFHHHLNDLGQVIIKMAKFQMANDLEQNKDVLERDFINAFNQLQAAAFQVELVKNEF